jgi:hypothetical protein
MIGAQIFTLIVSGRLISRFGKAWYIITPGPVLITIGGALLTSIRSPDTPISHTMGYGVLIGTGVGLFLQNTMILVQWDYHKTPKIIPQAMGAIMFWSFVGRILGISLGGVVFSNMVSEMAPHSQVAILTLPSPLVEEEFASLRADTWPGRDRDSAFLGERSLESGARGKLLSIQPQTDSLSLKSFQNLRHAVLVAYARTLSAVYSIAIPCGVIAFCSAFLINRNGGGPGTGAKKPAGQAPAEKDAEKAEKADGLPPVTLDA